MGINLIKRLFGHTDAHSVRPKRTVDTRRLVARVASGNVALQLGKFITREQIDAKRRDLSSYKFKLV